MERIRRPAGILIRAVTAGVKLEVAVMEPKNGEQRRKRPVYQDGKIYFNRATERKFFFALTIIMLLVGVLAKAGLF